MIIDVGRLARDGESFEGEDPADALGVGDALVEAGGPLRYRLHAQLVSGELIVRGELHMRVWLRCSRCTARFAAEVADPGFETVREAGLREEYVDLTPDMRESIILAFPSYPVCDRECRGLCAQCGANLNEGPCGCARPADNRWGNLDQLGF